ncbi:MAG: glycosyl transferase family 1 [Chloroflexi bacterium HGW-Chloroflexi-3]|nr:MAG: glycosyl transferase family 1 [Chloroflexi bacterium HGW-Chloroflexi-3]
MRIGHISFRLAGTDGVSLETAKIVDVLTRMGHSNYYFAGELDPQDIVITTKHPAIEGRMYVPFAHFSHPKAKWITENAFGTSLTHPDLLKNINDLANILEKELYSFIKIFNIELITVQNVFAIPINLALSAALFRVIKDTKIPTINHNHDFYWEREKYQTNCVKELLDQYFPPRLTNIRQVVINSQAQLELSNRGFESEILPNIFDFHAVPPGIDSYNSDLRSELGIKKDDLFFLQPTRVIPRKGIELAIELVSRLSDLPIKLIITHKAEHDTLEYLSRLMSLASTKNVDLRYLPERFQPVRETGKGKPKNYSLWDAYIHADFITYPSLYEGFGNALLETIYFKKPFLVNRYKIFQDDIEPTGIKAVKIEGQITDQAVSEVRILLQNREMVDNYVDINTMVGKKYFSYQTAQECLEKILKSFND